MAEPHASTAIGAGIAFGTLTITGSVLGMQFDALAIGFAASLLAILVLEPQGGTIKAAVWVALSMMLAALLSPALASAAAHYLPWLNAGESGRQACAALIALSTPTILPLLRTTARRKLAEEEAGK